MSACAPYNKTKSTSIRSLHHLHTVHVTENFTFYGRATFTSTDRSMVAGTDVADIAYGFCTEHRMGYRMVKPRA